MTQGKAAIAGSKRLAWFAAATAIVLASIAFGRDIEGANAAPMPTPQVFTVVQNPAGPANVAPGTQVDYAVDFTANASAAVTFLYIEGDLGTNLSILGSGGFTGGLGPSFCSASGANNQHFLCNLGSLGIGGSIATITVHAQVRNVADGSVTDLPASAFTVRDGFSATTTDAPSDDAGALTVQNEAFAVTTTDFPDPISSASSTLYTVAITNNGSIASGTYSSFVGISGGLVSNVVCPGGLPGSGSGSTTATCSNNAPLGASSSTSMLVTATANSSPSGFSMTATASFSAGILSSGDFTESTTVTGSVATATKLGFLAQPGSATSGVAFSTQPSVAVQDSGSATVTTDNTTNITLNITPGGGSLSCSGGNSKVATSGVATFSGCMITGPGTYTLHATAASLTQADGSPFTVSPAPATKLAFTAYPSSATVSAVFAPQPQVAIEDATGTLVSTDNSTQVTISLGSGPGSLSCTGGLTKTAVSGIAAFSGCSVSAAGSGYTLRATSSPILTQADSPSFSAGAFGPASKLGFTSQPLSVSAGIAFDIQPTVAVQDSVGLTVANDNTTVVTLSVPTGPGTITCSGGLSKTVSAGVATFSGCYVSASGGPYVIRATSSPAYTQADTSSFTASAGATKLGFTTQPTGAVAGSALGTQPVVAIQTAAGATVTTDSSTVITLQLVGAGTLTCTGGLSKTASSGVATFAGCSVDTAATGLAIMANATSLTSATSSAFDITAAPPTASAQLVVAAPLSGVFVPRSRLTFSANTGTLAPTPTSATFVIKRKSDNKYWNNTTLAWESSAVENTATAGSTSGTWELAITGESRRLFVATTVIVTAHATSSGTVYESAVSPEIPIR